MTDEELLMQCGGVRTFYLDGFGAIRKINGVIRSVGYVLNGGAQLNLIVSLAGANAANIEGRRILDENPVSGLTIWSGTRLSH